MKAYQTYLSNEFMSEHARRLKISIHDIKLAEMIVIDSIKIDFSGEYLLSLESLRLIPENNPSRHYHNAFKLMELNFDIHKKLWFTFVYDAFTNFDFKTINLYMKSSLSPQDEINKIASNILGAWLEIDEAIDFDKKYDVDTLQRLIEFQSEYLNSVDDAESEHLLCEIIDIMDHPNMVMYKSECMPDSSFKVILTYFLELTELLKNKNITSKLIQL